MPNLFIIATAVQSGSASVETKAEDVRPMLRNHGHRLAVPSDGLVQRPE